MGAMIHLKGREAVIGLDKGLYRREAVTLAAAAFSSKAEFFVEREDETALVVALQVREEASRRELEALAGEFLNEALNQELRLDLAKENSRIIELLTAQALYAARGAEPSAPDEEAEREIQRKAERFMAEAGAQEDRAAQGTPQP